MERHIWGVDCSPARVTELADHLIQHPTEIKVFNGIAGTPQARQGRLARLAFKEIGTQKLHELGFPEVAYALAQWLVANPEDSST